MCHRVSCFLWELLQKAALGDNFGLLVADDYKKWNVSTFLRTKVKPGGFTAEAVLKDECLAGNSRVWTGHGYRHADMQMHAYAHLIVQTLHAYMQLQSFGFGLCRSSADFWCCAAERHSGIACPRFWVGVVLWGCERVTADSPSPRRSGRGGVGLCGGGWWWSDSQQPLLGSQGKRRAGR